MPGNAMAQYRANRNALLLALQEGPVTAEDARRGMGVTQQTALRILRKFVAEGVAVAWWTPGTTATTFGLPRDRPEPAFASVAEAVIHALGEGPAKAWEVGARIGVKGHTAKRVLERLAEEGRATGWWAGGVGTVYGLPEHRPPHAADSLEELLLRAVAREPMTSDEAVQATGISESAVQAGFVRLRREGRVTKRAGRWTLPGPNGRPRERRPDEEPELDRLLRLYDRQAEALRKTQRELEDAGIYVELAGRAVLRDRVDAEA